MSEFMSESTVLGPETFCDPELTKTMLLDNDRMADRQFLQNLSDWRRYQIQVTPQLMSAVELLGGGQYTDPAHFLYELIQNADDNSYDPQTLRKTGAELFIHLSDSTARLINNEIGFLRKHVLAITSVGESSKSEIEAHQFVGEKGIGFKSVFEVMSTVEIRSRRFSFRLDREEMLVPKELDGASDQGTEMTFSGPTEKWSDVLEEVGKWGAEHLAFLLFLRKLKRLDIEHPSGRFEAIKNDTGNGRVNLTIQGNPVNYYVYRHRIKMPNTLFESRFGRVPKSLENKQSIPRELVLAVPLGCPPKESDTTLFAYLPITRDSFGLPMMLHFDFKVVTSREHLALGNAWNAEALKALPDAFCGLVSEWAGNDQLVDRIPELLPEADSQGEFSVESRVPASVRAQLQEGLRRLRAMAIFRSPHGKRRYRAAQMRFCDSGLRGALEPLSRPGDSFQLVRSDAETNHRAKVAALGTKRLSHREMIELLKRWRAPTSLKKIDKEKDRRKWLLLLANGFAGADAETARELRCLPLFPFRSSKRVSFRPIEMEGIEVILKREPSSAIDPSGIGGRLLVLEPRMTERVPTARNEAEKKRQQQSDQIFRWLRDVLGVKPADDLMMLEHAVIPQLRERSARGGGTSSPDESPVVFVSAAEASEQWTYLVFAASVLRRRATFVAKDSKQQEVPSQAKRFNEAFDTLKELALLPANQPTNGDTSLPGKVRLLLPSEAWAGEPYVPAQAARLGLVVFGPETQVAAPLGVETASELLPFLRRLGVYCGDAFIKTSVQSSEWIEYGLGRLPYSTGGHAIDTVMLNHRIWNVRDTLSEDSRADLFETLSMIGRDALLSLRTSRDKYFYYSNKSASLPGSIALAQCTKLLLARNKIGQPRKLADLTIADDRNSAILNDMPELLLCGTEEHKAFALLLGTSEIPEWPWYTSVLRRWRADVLEKQAMSAALGTVWSDFARYMKAAMALTTADVVRQYLNTENLIPWDTTAGAVDFWTLDGEFCWDPADATESMPSLKERAEENGLISFFQTIGFAPTPEPDEGLERWRYRARQGEEPSRDDLRRLLGSYEADPDAFRKRWKPEDVVWSDKGGWVQPETVVYGVPDVWVGLLSLHIEVVWCPTEVSSERLASLYRTIGVRPPPLSAIGCAAEVELKPIASALCAACSLVAQESESLRCLLPAGLRWYGADPGEGTVAVWDQSMESINLPSPGESVIVGDVLLIDGDDDPTGAFRRYLWRLGFRNEARAVTGELVWADDVPEPVLVPDDTSQGQEPDLEAAARAVREFVSGLSGRRGVTQTRTPELQILPDPTLLPTSLEEAEKRLLDRVARDLDPTKGLQSRVRKIFSNVASKDAQAKSSAIRSDLAGWYQGACQNCGEVIPRRDGLPYFRHTRLYKARAARLLDNVFNCLLLCPNCAARLDHNDWGFGEDAFKLRSEDIFVPDLAWPVPQASSAAMGYCPVRFFVGGSQWTLKFHPDHYECIRVAFSELGI